jgi:heat shock protein HslJ
MSQRDTFSRPRSFINLVTVLTVFLVLAQQTPAQDLGLGLFGKTWTLTEMEGRKFSADKPDLQFDRDQKRVSGSSGCNRFTGAFEIDGSMMKFSRIASTKMACVDVELQRVETKFLKLLETTTRFEVEGNTLRLYANDRPVLVFGEQASTELLTLAEPRGNS